MDFLFAKHFSFRTFAGDANNNVVVNVVVVADDDYVAVVVDGVFFLVVENVDTQICEMVQGGGR